MTKKGTNSSSIKTTGAKKTADTKTKKIKISGSLVGNRVNVLESDLLEKLKSIKPEKEIIFDLTKVDYIDSRGISLCIGMYKECLKKGFEFSIESSSNVYRILNQINLTRVFPIKEAS
jgi:anti-anti-sigma factor